jgi:multidrug efflux pump subunit AcrB
VWGLLFAMVLTLVVIPCLYVVVEDIKAKFSSLKKG